MYVYITTLNGYIGPPFCSRLCGVEGVGGDPASVLLRSQSLLGSLGAVPKFGQRLR